MRSRAAVIASRSIGQTGRSSVSRIVSGIEVDVDGAGAVVGDEHAPGSAADLAVFDVVLRLSAPGVHCDLVFFTAVWTDDGGGGIGRAVAKRKVFDRVVAVAVHTER